MRHNQTGQFNYARLAITGIGIGFLLIIIAFQIPQDGAENIIANSTNITEPANTTLTEEVEGQTPQLNESATESSTPTPTPIPAPFPISCRPQYPLGASNWNSDFETTNFTSLDEIYAEIYGAKRDTIDLYAVAYYNNRKAFEGLSNNSIEQLNKIDPKKLTVEKGSKLFLPPPEWINFYREFPTPILDQTNTIGANNHINISGSSALFPLSLQIATCYSEVTGNATAVQSKSTERGLFDYCQDDVSLFGASSKEIDKNLVDKYGCKDVNFLEFEVAKYTVIIFINDNNRYADDLIKTPLTEEEQIELLLTASLWSDIRGDWGDEPITRYYPALEGGIFEIVKNELFPTWSIETEIPNFIENEDYSIPEKVVANDYAIGISGMSYFRKFSTNLRTIPIDSILPNPDTVNTNYPLTRSLYLYIGETNYRENSLYRDFINYYLAYELDFIDELGYFRPSSDGFINNPNTIP